MDVRRALLIVACCIASFGAAPCIADPPLHGRTAATCAIAIVAILDGGGGVRAAVLGSARGPGAATGNIWVNTSAGPYRIRFAHRNVLSAAFRGDIDPIAFRLPPAATLENAFISELAAPPGDFAPCTIFEPWTPARGERLRSDVRLIRLDAVSPPALPVAEAATVDDPATACKSPDVAARTIVQAAPDEPPIAQQQGITGSVNVLVQIDQTSRVTAANAISAPSELLVAAALAAAHRSIFQTAIVGCMPVRSNALIGVDFIN